MHNKPHTPEAKEKIRLANLARPKKWAHLPHEEIVDRLLNTSATTKSIAAEYGCHKTTIDNIYSKYTTVEQRMTVKCSKQANSLKGYKHSEETRKRLSDANSGERNAFFGRKHSLLSKAKQSQRRMGKPLSRKTAIAISAFYQGIPSEEWSGFKTPELERLRRGTAYDAWRTEVFRRDDYTCQKCFRRGGHLNAHHIKLFAKFPELRFEIGNGITLCRACHRNVHAKHA